MLPNNQVRDPPRVTSLKMIPKDITAEFTEAASGLSLPPRAPRICYTTSLLFLPCVIPLGNGC